MNPAAWRDLAILTLKAPAQAARELLALQLERNVLWLAFALAIVLNTAAQTLSDLVLSNMTGELPVLALPPIAYAGFFTGAILLFVSVLSFVGPKMGGSGRFNDVFVLIIWLQYLRFGLELLVLVLLLVAPVFGALIGIAGSLVGLYIMVHFIDQAHRLNSLGQSVLLLLISIIAMAVVIYFVLSLAGGPVVGNATFV
ncbi:YIP1 family protein [Ruegeria sp. 2205SS24-7]|uniref:YIP1 family protein n=1 Tax=Ruegeria discodermiae TaxID=3064389 RepID=UPI0027416D6A|nr:YIP1 family protein [Ruegeria sp. 2205SS24-7]MDP5216158.1 YIP1 family protein [Ruegeria sp. 2205SS24-7]